MGVFDRLFGKGRKGAAARAAEVRGELGRAVEMFAEAQMPDEAARVMVLRGDGESDARTRLLHYTQAARTASEGTELRKEARKKRAELLLALAGDAAVSAVARHEVAEAARDLEDVGEPLKAAEAYARAGDKEGEARALQAAGDVERLEFLLSTEQHKERVVRAREDRWKDVDVMVASGRRREALASLEDLLKAAPEDATLRERASALRSRRALAPLVVVESGGERFTMVLGDEVVIGRSEGSIHVASNAVSRQHLRLFREAGQPTVRDLGSRNGTQLRGANLAGPIGVGEGLDLKLGREVPLRIAPLPRVEGAVAIELGGQRYVACLGPTRLATPGIELRAGADGWIELVTHGTSIFAGDVEFVPGATLLLGDAFATRRGGDPEVRVLST